MKQDLRLAFRLMVRQPLMATTAIVALTVGIGLANVGFATMEALLFSRLPFDPDGRFVRLTSVSQVSRDPISLAPESYGRLASLTDSLEHIGVLSGDRRSVELQSGPNSGQKEEVAIAGVTPASLPYLMATPLRGRLLSAADAEAGAPSVALVSEVFWRRSMGASESVLGAPVRIGAGTRTIVGVMPASFKVPNSPSFWVPLDERFRTGLAAPDAAARIFGVMAPGVSLDALSARLSSVSAQLRPSTGSDGVIVEAASFTDFGEMAPILSAAIVIVLVTVLLVIAANVGNLVLARSLARVREFALRAALGASRTRLVTQVLAEVWLLGFIAAIFGSLGARLVLRRFNSMDDVPFWIDFTGGTFTLVAVAAATLLATAVAGAWPALRATRRDLLAGLQASDGRSSDVRFGRVAGAMVVTQIAVSVVMLHGALIVAQAFQHYNDVTIDLPRNVLATGMSIDAKGPSAADVERLAGTLPGVIAVGTSTALPRHSPPVQIVEVEARPGEPAATPRLAPSAAVSSTYFGVLGASATAGRLFTKADSDTGAAPVAVVNEPFARAMFPGQSPIGRKIRAIEGGTPGAWRQVVGVVPELGLSVGDSNLSAGYYIPLTPAAQQVSFVLRVNGEPMHYVEPLLRAYRERYPGRDLFTPVRLEDVAADDRAFFRSFSGALIGVGTVTLVLALVGVYSMMSLIIERRTREIGIRVALGATPAMVTRTVASRAGVQVLAGGAIGASLALLSLQARGILVSRLGDGGPWTLPIVIGLLIAAGLTATWVPLRRALRIRPQEALKAE